MLHHNPRPPAIRFLREGYFFFAYPLKKLYWRVCKPRVRGVKTFVCNNNRILLVRLGYGGRWWALPGGAIERGEMATEAAIRETKEEAGINVERLEKIGSETYESQHKIVTVDYFYTTTTAENIIIDDQEVIDAGWFSPQELPHTVGDRLRSEIQMLENWKHGNV